MRLGRLFVAAALAAAVITGCGGARSSGANAATFADATCVDLATWAKSARKAFTDLQAIGQTASTDTAGAQQTLKTLSTSLNDADKATSALASGISTGAAPTIENGEEVKRSLVDALSKLRDLLSKARAKVDAFDVNKATQDENNKLKSDLQALTDGVAEAVSGLAPLNQNNELKRALERSEKCRDARVQLYSS
ncbi:MAG: hypothetical protein QOC92_2256 [Acidimicrobiaceae bacterium]|jgi:hypothetical protein